MTKVTSSELLHPPFFHIKALYESFVRTCSSEWTFKLTPYKLKMSRKTGKLVTKCKTQKGKYEDLRRRHNVLQSQSTPYHII